MKHLALVALTLISFSIQAQQLFLKSGEFTPVENIKSIADFPDWKAYQYNQKTYCLVQFNRSVSAQQRLLISNETGIQFYDYFPRWAFLAAIPANYPVNSLSKYGVRSLLPYLPTYKIAPKLNQRPFPSWMIRGNQQIEVIVEVQHSLSQQEAIALCANQQLNVIRWHNTFEVVLAIHENDIQTIAELPGVKFIACTSAPTVVDNLTERSNHRVNTIDAAYFTGTHYDGTGISVAVGDDGQIGPHIDFQGRLYNHTNSNFGTHADHVSGIVGGGGNFDPITSGNGRGADLHIYSDYDNLNNALTAYNTDGVRLTTNSLGQGCNTGYDFDAQSSDQLINSKFSLMSVHSAGNSGNGTCGGVPQGFFTITGGYKAGKNVITVGNVDNSDVLASSSSRGPSEDGRIKPEIVAVGTDVYSTQPDNTYASFSGTSMACPGVSGTLSSLWHSYRATHSGSDPYSGLMKALVMNTADDLGNPGPDFKFGFGRINARRAYKTMISNQFFIDSMNTGDAKDFFINVPPNTRQMKIMLYWNDAAGNPASSVALVNDLNLTVQEPSGNVIDPWVLNNSPIPASLNAPATRGGDALNNVEQVTLDSVFAGPCIISVYGNDIPAGIQKYVLVYEFIGDEVTMTYPQGGESFVPGIAERIRWDAFGNVGTFKLEYSANAGTTWTTIAPAINGNQRYFDWTPPAFLNTGQMKMRITRGSVFDETDTLFTVFEVPKNVTIDTACATTFHIIWDPVALATGYNIYSLGTKYMTLIGTSATNSYTITTGVNTTDTFYFAVSAINAINGANGLRTHAYTKFPGNVNCLDDAYNVATILPFTEAYTCAVTSPVPIKVKIKNVGYRPLVNLPVFYQVNANPVVADVVPGPIAIGDSTIFTFATSATMSVPMAYTVKTWSSIYTDVVLTNDSSQTSASVIIPTTITAPTVEDFEGPLFPPLGWRALDPDVSVKWQKTLCLVDPTGFNTHTAYMDFYNYSSLFQLDELETAQFDLTGVVADTVLMTFDVSHAYGPKGMDSLRILVSDDCAANFTPTTYYKAGAPLSTAGMMGTIFSPTLTTQWRNDRIDLTSYIGKKIFVRFRASNGNGNNLFIDNINIMLKDAWPLGTTSFGENSISVYPNPSDGNYTLQLNSGENKIVRYSIYNLAGQKLKENRVAISNGITKIALNLSSFASGMYMLEMNDGKATKKIKLIKY